MNAATAIARLRALRVPVLQTSEAAAVLGLSNVTAAQTLRRLGSAGLLRPLRHGLVWVPEGSIDPWTVLEYLSAPYPAYGSLYSALYLRGALSQLPAVHYAVTLGRTRRITTSVGTFSLHRVAPPLFSGFEALASGGKMATLEKALFDLAYLATARSRLFARPPELEVPRKVGSGAFTQWLKAIDDVRRREMVRQRLSQMLERAAVLE